MTKKSVLICEYCGKPIDQDDRFVQEIQRDGDEIVHEGDFHEECFLNSMIKDLEGLDFQVIRPRSEINKNFKENDDQSDLPGIDPEMAKTGLDLLGGLFNAPKPTKDPEKEKKILKEVEKKLSDEDKKQLEEARNKSKSKNEKQKRETKPRKK